MAEFARPDESGTTTDTSSLRASDGDTSTERAAPSRRDRAGAETRPDRCRRAESDGPESNGPESNGSGDPTAAKKRRRRGSRGGRGRKKPAGATGAGADNIGADPDDDIDDDVAAGPISAGEDWTDEAADRGLTSEDLGDDAREEAGLPARRNGAPKVGDSRPAATSPRAAAKPRIGDSRPAPASDAAAAGPDDRAEESAGEDGPKKRRRRRGGRGRSKGGGEAGTGTARGGESGRGGNGESGRSGGNRSKQSAPTYVDAGVAVSNIDVDGTAILDSLDEETLERRRGTRRKGRPAGRYLMVVHERDDGMAHIARARGPHARRALRRAADRRHDVDRRQHLPRSGPERAARAWKPRSSTSARRRTACSTAATSSYDRRRHRRQGADRASSGCCATASRSSCRSRRTRSATRARGSRRR